MFNISSECYQFSKITTKRYKGFAIKAEMTKKIYYYASSIDLQKNNNFDAKIDLAITEDDVVNFI